MSRRNPCLCEVALIQLYFQHERSRAETIQLCAKLLLSDLIFSFHFSKFCCHQIFKQPLFIWAKRNFESSLFFWKQLSSTIALCHHKTISVGCFTQSLPKQMATKNYGILLKTQHLRWAHYWGSSMLHPRHLSISSCILRERGAALPTTFSTFSIATLLKFP